MLHRPSGPGLAPAHYGPAVSRGNNTGSARGAHGYNNRGSGNRRHPPAVIYVYGGGYGWSGFGYAPWLYYPWLDTDLSYDLWHDSGGDASAPATGSSDAEYSGQADDPNNEAVADAAPQPGLPATQVPSGTPPATLLFKDHRSPLRVGNYVVSAQGLVVSDGGTVRQIPMDQLDIAATNQLNQQSGSGLVLPQ